MQAGSLRSQNCSGNTRRDIMRDDTAQAERLRHEDRLQALALVRDLCDRYGPELDGDELEALADTLLRVHGPDEQYPHLPDEDAPAGGRDFVVHSLEDEGASRSREARDRPAEPPESLPGAMQLQVTRLMAAANLTGRRRQVARLRLWGYAPAEIAGLLGIERSVVYLEWRYAKRALGAALTSGDYDRAQASRITRADARELFRSEQRKRLYRKPGHCARGKEKCRRTGVCKYAG
jgi:hypothetical protein